jgi:DNA-binding response OmpR family regulator
VTNLRKKIEPTPDRPRFLVSLRGLGYRFDLVAAGPGSADA